MMIEPTFIAWFEHVFVQGTIPLARMLLLTSGCILVGYGFVRLVEWVMKGGEKR